MTAKLALPLSQVICLNRKMDTVNQPLPAIRAEGGVMFMARDIANGYIF